MHDVEGQTLGNYRLIRLLGRGGSAKVYLGEHVHLNTQAAIKVRRNHATEEIQEDFLKEAQLIAGLEHPHIVRLLDFGIENQLSFLVMSYAPNGTLRQRHHEGSRLPLTTIVTYLKHIVAALQYAHEHHVIHRDVKPQNMLIGLHDEILLSDFGLAIASQSTSPQHMQNRAGTLLYMAPEQFEGKACPASDQYALGVVVYEWLCGEPPFQGSYHEIAMQHQLTSPPALHEKMPALPAVLEQVVFKALAKDPQERFASVQRFATAFEQACQPSSPTVMVSPRNVTRSSIAHLYHRTKLSLIPSLSVLVSWSLAITPYKGHSRFQAGILIGLTSIVIIASVGLLYLPLINNHANVLATATAQAPGIATASEAANVYATATSKGVMSGFDAQHASFNPYERVLTATNVSHLVLDWTVSTGNSTGLSPIIAYGTVYFSNGTKLYALNAFTGKPLWATSIGFSSSPAVANGVVYIGTDDDKLYAFDASTGRPRWAAAISGDPTSGPIVADGLVYICSYDDKLYAFDASTGRPRWTVTIGNSVASDLIVADGLVYIASDDQELHAFNSSTGRPRWAIATGNKDTYFHLLMAAGGIVYANSDDGQLYAFDTSTGKQLWDAPFGYDDVAGAAIANGVAYLGTNDGRLFAFDASTGKSLWTVTISNRTAISPISPMIAHGVIYIGSEDGKLFALAASTGKTLWSTSVGGVASAPVVAYGIVYVDSDVGVYDNNLYAFHLAGAPV